jgi:hypothetical protein
MKRYVFLLFFLIGLSFNALSQTNDLNEYSYIIVPKKFDFLHEEDQFQLNSLTRFLLNKHGFNALFNTDVPDNVRRCEGLWVEVLKSSGLVYTKLEVVIKDCKGNELYKSFQGKSKFKHYKKAYQDALRKAFKSFQSLNVDQPDIINYEADEISETTVLKKNDIDKKKIKTSGVNTPIDNFPGSSFSSYMNNSNFYVLRKTRKGYSFYEESNEGDLILIGNLLVNKSKLTYQDLDGNFFDAYFDTSKHLNIFIGEKTKVYILKDQ